MDVVFDARNPDEFFAFLALTLARNGWRPKTACIYTALILTLMNPTVAAVPNLLESRSQAWEREIKRMFAEHYVTLMKSRHADSPGVDCIWVDGAFECRWSQK